MASVAGHRVRAFCPGRHCGRSRHTPTSHHGPRQPGAPCRASTKMTVLAMLQHGTTTCVYLVGSRPAGPLGLSAAVLVRGSHSSIVVDPVGRASIMGQYRTPDPSRREAMSSLFANRMAWAIQIGARAPKRPPPPPPPPQAGRGNPELEDAGPCGTPRRDTACCSNGDGLTRRGQRSSRSMPVTCVSISHSSTTPPGCPDSYHLWW